MKHYFSVLALFILLASCGGDPSENSMLLSGEVRGLKKGNLYLQKVTDTAYVTLDSLIVDGTAIFSFSEEVTAPEVFYLTLTFQDSSNVIKRLPFFAEAGSVTVNTTLENYERDAQIVGSVNQEKLNQYKILMKRYNDKNLDLIKKGFDALKENNDSLVAANKLEQDKLLKNRYLAAVNFAINNGAYEVAPYITLNEIFDINTKYLDTIYTSLTPKIKDSKYGKALESFIKERKN
ncbi:MAG: DUF4369 domain-containing protein [Bacteroidota bacterium]